MTLSSPAPVPPVQSLLAQPIAPELFAPYGQVIFPSQDGQPYSSEDAQLELNQGIPRFYIMRLHHKGQQFSRITRHVKCTQCLGALAGRDWFIAVAPPSTTSAPELGAIAAFHIPGDCFIKLHVGTWHAGPLFDQEFIDFYNLELSDTNITDHDTYNLLKHYRVEFAIAGL